LSATLVAELHGHRLRVCATAGEPQGNPDESDIVVWDPGTAHWALTAAMPAAGAVLVLERQGDAWTVARTLRSPRPVAYGGFGAQLALGGPVLAVLQTRPATVWTFNPQALAQPGSEIAAARGFARSVAVLGERVIVGGIDEARVFRKGASGWRIEERIKAPAAARDLFTGQITATRELLVTTIAGLNQGDAGAAQGRVDVFRRGPNAWRWEATLRHAGSKAPFGFDCCVAVDASDVIVTAGGAPLRFRRTAAGWQEQTGSGQ
jgi:hypothetical protein